MNSVQIGAEKRSDAGRREMVQLWGFYLFTTQSYFPTAAQVTEEMTVDAFDHWTDLIAKSESWGLDGVSFAEHHYNTAAVCPSPHLLIANLAARTKRLKFTTLGSVLSLHYPWRFIAECGMLDALTHGRFEPGIGPGSGPKEAIMSGFAEAEARPRYESGAEVFRKSLEETYVTHHDQFTNIEKLGILPRWRPKQGQSVWVTVMSPDSAISAAKNGWKLCTAWLPDAVVFKLADTYRQAAAESGQSTDPSMLGVRRRVFLAESDSEAQEKFEAAQNLIPFLMARSDGSLMEAGDERVRQIAMQPDDFVIGSPKTVADKLVTLCSGGGIGNLMAWWDFASFQWEDLARSHELFGTRVGPVLRSANVAASSKLAS
jgi:alkanesulfonate monooxygenase SsuD/methylene tetrahydromethanopterin reductase-like flavin-dependent oxidoreductase (luciferase family)